MAPGSTYMVFLNPMGDTSAHHPYLEGCSLRSRIPHLSKCGAFVDFHEIVGL